jgi:hypothetical protein
MIGGDKAGAFEPDEHNEPAMIGEIYKFFSVIGSAKRMSGSVGMDFHGDGSDSDIDVVSFDGKLLDAFDISISKHRGQLRFAGTNIHPSGLASNGSASEFPNGTAHSPYRIMRGRSQFESLLGLQLIHSGEHGFTSITLDEAPLPELVNETIARNAKACGDLLNRYSGKMEFERLVNIERIPFSGHVYNLQTRDGLYIAHSGHNGNRYIAVHNCRCGIRMDIEGYSPELRRSREQGIIPYQTYSDWESENGPTVH